MFITLEGVEGSGKSTLAKGLAERLQARGRETLLTREPGGTDLGRQIRSMLLRPDSPVNAQAELFLFLADRAQHVHEVILPALSAGTIVLCDRYVDSTLIYQGLGRGFAQAQLRELCDLATGALWPDLTFVLDLDIRLGLTRAAARHQMDNTLATESRFEAESLHFHEAVRQGFKHCALEEPQRVVLLDASLPPHDVLEAAWNALTERGLAQ